jgi:PKD repeat protein
MAQFWRFSLLALLSLGVAGCFQNPGEIRAVIETDPYPPRGPYPLALTLSGEKSRGNIEEWIWTILKEDKVVAVLAGPVVRYDFPQRGKYRVYLEVRHARRFAQTTIEVDVRSQPPLADFAADPYPEVEEGKPVTFDASSSQDPDGTIKAYIWNFGDGFWQETQDPRVTHRFSTGGKNTAVEYTVRLVVEDDYGDRAETARRIRVVPKGCASCG